METANPVFFNDTFARNFNRKLDFKFYKLSDDIQTLHSLLQLVILDYKFNRNYQTSYPLLLKFDATMRKMLDHYRANKINEKDHKSLTELLTEAKTNSTIKQIRSDEEKYGQKQGDQAEPKSPNSPEGIPSRLDIEQKPTDEISSPERIEDKQDEAKEDLSVATQAELADLIKEGGMSADQNLIEDRNTEAASDASPTKLSNPTVNSPTLPYNADDLKNVNLEKPSIKEFLKTFDKMKEEFEEHRVENAKELKDSLLQLTTKAGVDEEDKKFFDAKLYEARKMLKEIDMWYETGMKTLREMDDDEGYIEDKGPKTYTLKYKAYPDGRAILKMEGLMQIPLFNLLALMYEADGFNKWVPFCAEAKLLKGLHRCSHVYWMRYGLPMPLTDRECHCYGFGIDRFARNGSVLLLSRSIDSDTEFLQHYGISVPKETKLVRMDIEVATELIPISKNATMMRQITTVDVKVKNTPPTILTWISRKTGQHMFETTIKRAKDLKGTMWEKGIEQNKDFYGWLAGKVNNFMQGHELA